jgi:hypothetical protein
MVDARRQAVVDRRDDHKEQGASERDAEKLDRRHGRGLGEDRHGPSGRMLDAEGRHHGERKAGGKTHRPSGVGEKERRGDPDQRRSDTAADHVGGLRDGRTRQEGANHGGRPERRHQERHARPRTESTLPMPRALPSPASSVAWSDARGSCRARNGRNLRMRDLFRQTLEERTHGARIDASAGNRTPPKHF